ncbi:hypothetical protein TIFTF001_045862 [Ficus carica]|uniref:Uncharacterized protein n=1 Tax=Ficus carica TaxID=3494 RepID=A0AA88CPD9_FICCA|nr:hypothetical protein TIFTF001_045862 [Ficus carica]
MRVNQTVPRSANFSVENGVLFGSIKLLIDSQLGEFKRIGDDAALMRTKFNCEMRSIGNQYPSFSNWILGTGFEQFNCEQPTVTVLLIGKGIQSGQVLLYKSTGNVVPTVCPPRRS